MTWWWAEKGRNDAWRGIVKKFHDAQKDIRIQEVGFPYSEFFQRVTTQLAGGRLDADVLSFYDELGIRLIKTGALAPRGRRGPEARDPATSWTRPSTSS